MEIGEALEAFLFAAVNDAVDAERFVLDFVVGIGVVGVFVVVVVVVCGVATVVSLSCSSAARPAMMDPRLEDSCRCC